MAVFLSNSPCVWNTCRQTSRSLLSLRSEWWNCYGKEWPFNPGGSMCSVALAGSNKPLSHDLSENIVAIWMNKLNCRVFLHRENTNFISCKDGEFYSFLLRSMDTVGERCRHFFVAMPTSMMDKEFKITKHQRCILPPDLWWGIEVPADNQSKRQQSLLQTHWYWFPFLKNVESDMLWALNFIKV